MYEKFYGLNRLPFETTADPNFFYASEQHREALAAIEYAIRLRKGIVLITGNIGSGKTTVGRMMCKNCDHQATIIELIPRHSNGVELLKQIMRNVRIPVSPEDSYATLSERLSKYLTGQADQNQPVVLLVDEAQSLENDGLEELRVLSNLNTSTQKLIQVVLIGQPELRERIRHSEFDALRQRIVLAKLLSPLSSEETASYIKHRIQTASINQEDIRTDFTGGALREIHRISEGVPRLINTICDNCLLLGFVDQTRSITAEMVHRVVQDMVPRFDESVPPGNGKESNLSLAGNF